MRNFHIDDPHIKIKFLLCYKNVAFKIQIGIVVYSGWTARLWQAEAHMDQSLGVVKRKIIISNRTMNILTSKGSLKSMV